MDLNQKYADHQRAVMRASAARSESARREHLETATDIATQIEHHQLKLGAAASCAWSMLKLGSVSHLSPRLAGIPI